MNIPMRRLTVLERVRNWLDRTGVEGAVIAYNEEKQCALVVLRVGRHPFLSVSVFRLPYDTQATSDYDKAWERYQRLIEPF